MKTGETWLTLDKDNALPCPKCGKRDDLAFFANVVCCEACEHYGPSQEGPELICDGRYAIEDWNEAIGGA